MEAMRSEMPNARHLHLTAELGAKSEVLISIKDTGPGLSADQRERAFDPFFTTKSDGMGLGLAVSRSIVEAHDGELRLRETGPQGTTFEIALPIGMAPTGSA
jgi:signal transduction histidine kinase